MILKNKIKKHRDLQIKYHSDAYKFQQQETIIEAIKELALEFHKNHLISLENFHFLNVM
jgi:hypothetical protein